MKLLATLLSLATAIAFFAAPAVAQQKNSDNKPTYSLPTDPYARDLIILSKWFEGEFDNEEQIWFEEGSRSATPEDERHERLHTIHKRLDLPEFGEHVFYVEEYKDNDLEQIVRQRLVIFSSDEEKGIRMQQGFFKDTKKAQGAHQKIEKLANLKAKDVFFLDECDVYWNRSADQFVGSMRPKACVFGKDEKRRYSVHNLILSHDKYWRVDMTRLVSDDSIHVGLPEDKPHQMRRVKQFVCNITIRGSDGNVQRIENTAVHSQGGILKFKRDDNGEELFLRMRDKQYPYYSSQPDFIFLSLRKEGEPRSIAYAIADPQARRMGFNSGDYGIGCTRKGFTFDQPIEVLDRL